MHGPDPTQPVAGMDDATVDELLGYFSDLPLTIQKPPQTGLLMMSVTDSFNTGFHLGEVLVTEARVSLDGTEGYGMVSGEAPRKALARAAVDALLRCGRYQSLCESVKVLLQHEQERQHQSERVAAAMAHSTRVNFDIMPGA